MGSQSFPPFCRARGTLTPILEPSSNCRHQNTAQYGRSAAMQPRFCRVRAVSSWSHAARGAAPLLFDVLRVSQAVFKPVPVALSALEGMWESSVSSQLLCVPTLRARLQCFTCAHPSTPCFAPALVLKQQYEFQWVLCLPAAFSAKPSPERCLLSETKGLVVSLLTCSVSVLLCRGPACRGRRGEFGSIGSVLV